jgi:hypothetical protein
MFVEKQRFGRGLIPEISKYIYKNPIVVYREDVSNALDAMDPYRELEAPRVEIHTNCRPDGDIVIEDWGTGIENYEEFLTIAEGEKRVRGEVGPLVDHYNDLRDAVRKTIGVNHGTDAYGLEFIILAPTFIRIKELQLVNQELTVVLNCYPRKNFGD